MININKTFAVALAIVLFAPVFAFAEPTVSDAGNAGTQAVASAPAVTDAGNASVSAPSVTDQGNASVTTSSNTPSVTDQGNAAVSTPANTPSVTDQGNAAVVSSGNTNTGGNTGGSTGGSTGGGSSANNVGSGSGFSTGGGSSILVNTVTSNNCAYITDYLRFGGNNSVSEVTKLQTFLKTVEGLNVDINGKYDTKTVEAVKAFQTKYLNETMIPWGVKNPSGEVYFTTKNKINEIYCKTKISLTDSQKSEIAKYKLSLVTGSESTNTNSDNASTTVGISNGSSTDQTATVSNASFVSRCWKFIKKLFGR